MRPLAPARWRAAGGGTPTGAGDGLARRDRAGRMMWSIWCRSQQCRPMRPLGTARWPAAGGGSPTGAGDGLARRVIAPAA